MVKSGHVISNCEPIAESLFITIKHSLYNTEQKVFFIYLYSQIMHAITTPIRLVSI